MFSFAWFLGGPKIRLDGYVVCTTALARAVADANRKLFGHPWRTPTKRATAIRIGTWSLTCLALCGIFAGLAGTSVDPSRDSRPPGATATGSFTSLQDIASLPAPPTPGVQDSASQDRSAPSPFGEALSVELDRLADTGGITPTVWTAQADIPPVQLADSDGASGDAIEPPSGDMPPSPFVDGNVGLAGSNLLSHLATATGGGGGGRDEGTPTRALQEFTPQALMPGGAPGGAVPEPTALDLFQLAGALMLGLALRRFRP